MSLAGFLSHFPGMPDLAGKIISGERITAGEALELFRSNHLALSGLLAVEVKRRISGDHVFFNRNFHIEPSNICVNHCRFCSFRRDPGQKGSWECTIEEMAGMVKSRAGGQYTEMHIVGGVHPSRNLHFYADLLRTLHREAPHLHIKAFTAVEVDHMCRTAGIPVSEGLQILKAAGLGSMPGGGAEIFDEKLRAEIAPGKTSSERWLEIHRTAHQAGIPTNATMLYGLKESYEQRIDHLMRLRNLQDETGGFNAFIPLKFKRNNNLYASSEETTLVEELKNYAVSRIFLDNIPHLKAYWPMTGKPVARLSLHFGVDDLDGTIDDSTRIYSMAGSGETNPAASTEELSGMIAGEGYIPTERDSLYQLIRTF